MISALVVQNPFRMGYDGTNAAVKIIREGAKVESEDTGSTIVTKDNLKTRRSSPSSTRAARTHPSRPGAAERRSGAHHVSPLVSGT